MLVDVAILGGGVSALATAVVIKEHAPECRIALIAPSRGEFGAGGLRCIQASEENRQLLSVLALESEVKELKGAVLWDGEFYPWPLPRPNCALTERIKDAHWQKTRGGGKRDIRAMNSDGAHLDSVYAVKGDILVHMEDHLKRVGGVSFIREWAAEVHPHGPIVTAQGSVITSAHRISTVPLPRYARLIGRPWQGQYMTLRVLRISGSASIEHFDWDYMYLPGPYTRFHRVSRGQGRSVDFEFNDNVRAPFTDMAQKLLWAEARALFNISESCNHRWLTLNGHILPGASVLDLLNAKEGSFHIGRYAEWKPRAKLQDSINKARQFVSENL